MPPTNDFIPFCPTDTGTNLLSEADYAAAADRISGNKPGVASAKLNNKALRQSTAVASGVAQLVSLITGASTLDDGDQPKLYGQIASALTAYPPVVTSYLTGTGFHLLTFIFSIASGSATAGATYTNNGFTFTVKQTVASGLILKATGTGYPAVSGALTKATGTGDATLVFYAVRAPICLRARMVGGGGGGAGSGNSGGVGAGAGGDTTFGASLLSAGGGGGGVWNASAVNGGVSSLGSGPVGLALTGGCGATGALANAAGVAQAGGSGGSSAFGGSGPGGYNGGTGEAGIDNTGGGGGGGSSSGTGAAGGGGGSGGFIDAVIFSPAASYAFSVGVGGTAGGAGAGGFAGAVGGSGIIEVTEFYQ